MKMPKFGPSEMFRLRHSLAALVEELKFHKKCELDNESKIQELVNRNHALHKEWDTERQKARLKEEGFERAISELKLQYENKLRRLNVEQRQKKVKEECNLFAKDRMKEEMRQLQMTTFQQEKTIKELETKLQSQESSRESALCQWTGMEEKIANLSKIYQHTLDSVQRLERDAGLATQQALDRLDQKRGIQYLDPCENWFPSWDPIIPDLRYEDHLPSEQPGKVGCVRDRV